MTLFKVWFNAVRTSDGTIIHVQNYIGGYRGQHHVHSEESFKRWAEQVDPENLHITDGECRCGLTKPGQVREYDGYEWFNDRFLKEKLMCPKCNRPVDSERDVRLVNSRYGLHLGKEGEEYCGYCLQVFEEALKRDR